MQKTKSSKLKSPVSIVTIWLLITIIAIFLHKFSVFEHIESSSLDFRFKHFPIEERADSSIVLVAIDDQSLEFANNNGTFWPWPREFYAFVTDYLTQCGAKQVIFDIQFNEDDYNRGDIDSAESDRAFAQSMEHNGEVILSGQALLDKKDTWIHRDLPELKIAGLPHDYPSPYQSLSLPIEKFRSKASAFGLINIIPDNDGVVRRVPLIYQIAGKPYPQISLIAWVKQIDADSICLADSHLKVSGSNIPLIDSYNYLINWYGKGDVDGVFKYIPFSALVQSAAALAYNHEPAIEKSFFKDKIIIIGATAPGLLDLKTSPTSKVVPGMEIWATVLSNLKNSDFITIEADYYIYLIILILVMLIILIFNYQKTLYAHLELVLVIIFIHFLLYYFWSENRLYLPWFIFVITIIFTYIIILLVNYLSEGREKLKLKRIFSRYVHPDLVDILVNSSDDFEMGGREVEATVLFSDIYNFTNYSESMKAKDLVTELNNYFEKFTEIILSNHGMLDKFTGDGLMALFGSPLIRIDHANLACKVALAHKKYSDSLPDEDINSHFHKKTRIGINTGLVVIGNIGSSQRSDYTAIGDAVNLSARLESVNKIFKTSIIIGEVTWAHVHENYICRELDRLKVKGKDKPTRIYELICEKKELTEKITYLISQYEKGLKLYQEAKFLEASLIFEDLYNSEYQDYPACMMLERCNFLIKNPPERWDGIFTLTVK